MKRRSTSCQLLMYKRLAIRHIQYLTLVWMAKIQGTSLHLVFHLKLLFHNGQDVSVAVRASRFEEVDISTNLLKSRKTELVFSFRGK